MTQGVPQDVERLSQWLESEEGQRYLSEKVAPFLFRSVEPSWEYDLLGTERASDEPSESFEDRLTRCYELSAYALLFGSAPKGSKLVHGSMHGPGGKQRIGHGWLRLPGGKVWEPITARVYDEQQWMTYADAKVERVYTRAQASDRVFWSGVWGRWHESRWP